MTSRWGPVERPYTPASTRMEKVRERRGLLRKSVENVSKSIVEARTLGTPGGRSNGPHSQI